MDIGDKLKRLRRTRGLTQEELAARSELTKGYISQLENNNASPSIATLKDILNVLGVTLSAFFTENKREKLVFGQADYFESVNGEGTNLWLIPNSQKNEMEPIILTLPANGASDVRYPFEGEEFGYVLEGRVELIAGEEKYKVKRGEAFYLDGGREHQIVNTGKGVARILWITTPSNF